ncbi:hypothetical protein BBK82_10925 [Lentzea guizhouensis]|uniref:Uncharacterized protein n=1 Tax=Lentzea guizhouensis TaxID=1586287 RepID=A0A1B2HFK8_9PSEU|nr:hypothetical protein BBK82_10925 [Lentzea guizhouensis]
MTTVSSSATLKMTSSSFQNGCFFLGFFFENLGVEPSSPFEEDRDRDEGVEKRDVGSAGPSPAGGVVSQVDEESSFTR